MTEWLKNPSYNIFEGTVEPAGPMNVFNEKLAVVEAVNRAINAKTEYDAEHPPVIAAATSPPGPIGAPIGTGGPILVDQSRYMIDASVSGGRRRR